MKVLAHRGQHDGSAHENSRKAVERAFESTADGIEVDLQLLGDGTFVLFHDFKIPLKNIDSLNTTLLSNLTLSELRNVLSYEILTLTELIDRIPPSKKVILECKVAPRNLSLFRRQLWATLSDMTVPDNIVFSSLNLYFLEELRYYCDYPLAPVIGEFSSLTTAKLLPLDKWCELHLSFDLCDENSLRKIRNEADIEITAWTVNSSQQVQSLETRGIKCIMTDNSSLYTCSDKESANGHER